MIDPARLRRLESTIKRLAGMPTPFTGNCFRMLKPRFGNSRDALSGVGSRSTSGRYHVKGAFLIVYTSCSFEGAGWEFTHTARNRALDVASLLPVSVLSVYAKLSGVLDLTNGGVRRALGVTVAEVRSTAWTASPDETLTQVIGRLAFEAGFEAILSPSAGGSPNLNLLPENVLPGSTLQIINESELPPPP